MEDGILELTELQALADHAMGGSEDDRRAIATLSITSNLHGEISDRDCDHILNQLCIADVPKAFGGGSLERLRAIRDSASVRRSRRLN